MNALSLLDKSIDDIEDMPGFAVPQNGLFSFRFSSLVKTIADKECVEVSFEVLEALELNDPGTAGNAENKAGTKFSTLFFLEGDNADKSVSRLKEMLAPVAEATGERNLLKLVTEVCKDLIAVGKVKRREDKKEKGKFYADVSDLQLS